MMTDFYQKPNDSWWLHVTGKGLKDRKIPVSDEMLIALARYRRSRGLSPFPFRGEHEPLLTVARTRMTEDGDIDDEQALRSERAVREVVQKCFDASYKTMSKDKSLGENAMTDAESLREATVHWLRHTSISVDIKQRDPHHVRIDA